VERDRASSAHLYFVNGRPCSVNRLSGCDAGAPGSVWPCRSTTATRDLHWRAQAVYPTTIVYVIKPVSNTAAARSVCVPRPNGGITRK
jgi:hypothetical protein